MRKHRLLQTGRRAAALGAALVLTLAGCSGKTAESPASSAAPAAESQEAVPAESMVPDSEPAEAPDSKAGPNSVEKLHLRAVPHIFDVDQTKYWNDDDGFSGASATYTSLELEQADRYEALNEKLTEMNSYMQGYAAGVSDEFLKDEYNDFARTADVLRADSRIVSYYSYTEVPFEWGSNFGWFYNYDPETGAELALSDVVRDINEVTDLLVDELDELDTWMNESEMKLQIMTDDINWGLGYDGLHVIIAEGSDDGEYYPEQEILLPFSEYGDLFQKNYLDLPQSYAMPMRRMLDNEDEFSYQLDMVPAGPDDTKRNVMLYGHYDDGSVEDWTVQIEETELSFEGNEWTYSIQPYYVKTADGGTYLYVQLNQEDDYASTQVIRIEPDDITDLGEVEEYVRSRYLEDPDCFWMGRSFDLLGTNSGAQEVSVGTDGLPMQVETPPYYTTEFYTRALRLRDDMELPVLTDHRGDPDGEDWFPEDSIFVIVGMDGDGHVELRSDEGTYVWLEVDNSEYPGTIDGTDEDEIFEGVMYAG